MIVLVGFALVFVAPLGGTDPIAVIEARTVFVQSLLSVVAGLFGAATGFYFGASQAKPVADPGGHEGLHPKPSRSGLSGMSLAAAVGLARNLRAWFRRCRLAVGPTGGHGARRPCPPRLLEDNTDGLSEKRCERRSSSQWFSALGAMT